MSYQNPYAQQGRANNPYGGAPNPYDQRGNDYGGNTGNYGGNTGNYGGNTGNYGGNTGNYAQPSMEMQNINTNNYGSNQNSILDECREIDRSIDQLEQQLETIRKEYTREASASAPQFQRLEGLMDGVMDSYRSLVARMRKIKSSRESGNPRNAPQVGRVDRRLKAAINKYQQLDSEIRRDMRSASARQYRIVNPAATEEEVQAACENPDAPIFQQALMNSNRSREATSVLNQVRSRHDEIQKIERQMVELAQLFQDLDTIVMEQEPLVANIEQKGEEVHENVVKANEEIGGAVEKARSARRKKWWCLLICILIIIIVVIIAVVVVEINKK